VKLTSSWSPARVERGVWTVVCGPFRRQWTGPPKSGCKFQRSISGAQARYLRALGLRRGLWWTQNLQCCPQDVPRETQVSQSVPQDCPTCPKEATKVPQRKTKGAQCTPQSMLWHSKASSKESYIHQNSRSTAPAATMLHLTTQIRTVRSI